VEDVLKNYYHYKHLSDNDKETLFNKITTKNKSDIEKFLKIKFPVDDGSNRGNEIELSNGKKLLITHVSYRDTTSRNPMDYGRTRHTYTIRLDGTILSRDGNSRFTTPSEAKSRVISEALYRYLNKQ